MINRTARLLPVNTVLQNFAVDYHKGFGNPGGVTVILIGKGEVGRRLSLEFTVAAVHLI